MAFRPLGTGIFAKMLLTIAPAALVPLVIVIALSSERTHRLIADESLRYAKTAAEAHAGVIGARLGEKAAVLKTLAASMSEYKSIPAPIRREWFSSLIKLTLRSQLDIIAAWTLWEPGAIEDDPEKYRGTPLWVPNGGFNAVWYRDPIYGAMLGSVGNSVYDGVYYLEPKDRKVPVLVKPYEYSYTHRKQDSLMKATVAVPIIYGGEFKGVVGFDIDAKNLRNIVDSISIFQTGYASLVSADGSIISYPDASQIGMQIGKELPPQKKREYLRLIEEGKSFTFNKISQLTGVPSTVFGVPVRAGTALPHWMLLLVVPMEEVSVRADRATSTLILIGLIAVALLLAAIYLAARGLTRPLVALTRNIEAMADGAKPGRLPPNGTDELASLASSFNRMSERLGKTMDDYHAANQQLEGLNAKLETKVAERTSDLERALNELRTAQDQMLKAEKFALLGRLSATVAHELNTPLGAIKSSTENLRDLGQTLWPQLIDFARQATIEETKTFLRLVEAGLKNSQALPALSDRTGRRRLSQDLEASGYQDTDSIVADVETLGALENADDVKTLLAGGKREAIALAARIAGAGRSGTIIKLSSEKAAITVSALVGYARTEEFDITETVDLVKEIDGILVLYYGNLKHSVELVKDYRCLEPVPGLRDKLNQVWVNLINNALYAMKNSGRLEVRTERIGDEMAVSIIDSGPGIPPEVQRKIFTPFFTTKPAGEGTGLGLEICRKIAERHGGRIAFDSVPGRTAFTVYLPFRK